MPKCVPPADREEPDYHAIVIALLPMITTVVSSIGRRYRLGPDEREELHSVVCLKLVSDGCAILRKFEGRSGVRTYLTTVVTRIWLDLMIARCGKWRPSAVATRLGPGAVQLERLMLRDGLSLSEAGAILTMNLGMAESVDAVHDLYEALPVRNPPVRLVTDAVLEGVPIQSSPSDAVEGEDLQQHRRLRRVLLRLTVEERGLLLRRYMHGQTVADIARELSLDQKELYRRYDRLLGEVRRLMALDTGAATRAVVRCGAR